jgi:hypothetical protein
MGGAGVGALVVGALVLAGAPAARSQQAAGSGAAASRALDQQVRVFLDRQRGLWRDLNVPAAARRAARGE